MGVDCRICLPLDVPIEEVGEVMAVLAGVPFCVHEFSDGRGGPLRTAKFHKDNLKYNASDFSPGMYDIVFKNEDGLVDGETEHFVYFHHCSIDESNGKVYNVMSPPSTPFWCAMGKRLVEFFGGDVLFADCSAEKGGNICRRKRRCPVDRWGRIPSDGKVWQEYQNAIINMPKISEKDLKIAWKAAAYNSNFNEKTGRRVEEAKV